MNPQNQFYGKNYGRRPYQGQNGNRNFGNFLIGGALGYGLGYFTPRPNYPYPIYPVVPFPGYPPYPIYRPF